MSDDTYWWQLIDSDEHWQWEQEQRLNKAMQSGLQTTPDLNEPTKAQSGQEKAA